MVSMATFLTMIFSLILSTVLPIAGIIYYAHKNKDCKLWSAWLLGAAGFTVFQLFIRVPILGVLGMQEGFVSFTESHYVLYCFLLALTAGLFELFGRYAVAKIMSKNLTCKRSFAAGLGHGGIEAIIIVGTTYISNIVMAVMINSDSFDTLILQTAAAGADVSQLEMIKEMLISTNPVMFCLGGYERIMTMIFHAAMTMIVCYFVSRKKDIVGLGICLASHTLVDFVGAFVQGLSANILGNVISQNTSYVIIYSFLTAAGIASVIVIRKIKKVFPEPDKVSAIAESPEQVTV